MSDMGEALAEALDAAGIGWLLTVPVSGMARLFDRYGERGRCLYATREEEAVAVAAGLALAGERPLVLMQQSGVGNSLNAVFTLADAYGIYFPILVCDRTTEDPNPVQRASARGTGAALQAIGCTRLDLRAESGVERFVEALDRRSRWLVVELRGKE
ncbi:MAG TPA: thiamine pyrophosphate-binding protein [Longimicrobiaceae bacterium]|nr:thiamine pyrophosphate-binding protein [Longimicrobiaceae bacterium]